MAIAYDNSTGTSVSNNTSVTISHTTSGTNRILFVTVAIYNNGANADQLTGITYAGASMTYIGKRTNSTNGYMYLYYLANPALGANNIVATCAISVTELDICSASYTGAKQTGIPDSTANGGSSSPYTQSTTTVANNCWLVMGGYTDNGAGTTAGTGTVNRYPSRFYIADSNGAKSPAGSYSLQITASQNIYGIIASFAPVVTPRTQFRSLLGVGI